MTLAAWQWPALWEACVLTPDAVSGAQLWRLWSAHWLHLDASHAASNLLALAMILVISLRWRMLHALLAALLLLMPLLSLGLLLWRPDLQWYVGLSGLLHAAVTWLLFRHGGRVLWLGLALMVIKLLWQSLAGVETWVVQEAHWLGSGLGVALMGWPGAPAASRRTRRKT